MEGIASGAHILHIYNASIEEPLCHLTITLYNTLWVGTPQFSLESIEVSHIKISHGPM